MNNRIPLLFLRFLLTIILFARPSTAYTRDTQLYTSDTGLTSTLVNKILYDSRGMVWIATEDGLNRFDGSKFTMFEYNPADSTSLASDFVNNIFESSDGRLFVTSHGGLQLYDPLTESFSAPLPSDNGTVPHGVSDMVQRKSGEIWVGGNAIYRLSEDGDSLLSTSLPSDISYIYRMYCDRADNMWFVKRGESLIRMTPDGKLTYFFNHPGSPEIISITEGLDGSIYAGSSKKGLYRLDGGSDRFERMPLGTCDNAVLYELYPNDNGKIFIATDGNGALIYDPADGSVKQGNIPIENHDKLKVHCLTKDANGNLWLGIYQKGLMRIAAVPNAFRSISHSAPNTALIGNSCIKSILVDSDGDLWIGTDNEGLYMIGDDKEQSRHLDASPAVIMALEEDRQGRIWVGSYHMGVSILDKKSGRFTPVNLPSGDTNSKRIFDLDLLPDGDMLIATMGAGLYRHHSADGRVTAVTPDDDDFNPWLNSVSHSTDGKKIYAGTYDGLYIMDSDGSHSRQVRGGDIITTIYVDDQRQALWAGTPDGLIRLDPEGKTVATYHIKDGLPSKGIYAIEDDGKDLWLSTSRGLSRFNVAEGKFSNFDVHSGLPNNEFAKNSSFRAPDGTLYFGGINGLAYFNLQDTKDTGRKLTLRVTDFYIGNKEVWPGMLSGGHEIIDRPVFEAETFKLAHDDNTFAIRVNNMEFADPQDAEYFYSFDKDEWTPIMKSHSMYGGATLTFANVASGRHSLDIKAVSHGTESDTLSLTIDIAHVWWETWWAKVIYALIGLVLLWLAYREVRRRMLLKRAEIERKHKAEMLETKLQFYTNISHEIRTPLTLVISPLQKLQEQDKDPERNYAYRTIMRNAKRILRLINELMDIRKIDNNQMRMRFVKIDLTGFISDLYETFLPAATAKHVEIVYKRPEHPIDAWVDRSNFDKIVMNLLSNALKFTPSGGKITIALTAGEDASLDTPLRHFARISVTDTGIGIAAADRDKVFKRFFQGSNNHSGGTGIGLHLTSQLVELHHGAITVADNPEGQGTCFEVRIPLGSEHLSDSEIAKDEANVIAAPKIADIPDIPDIPEEPEADTPAKARKTKGTVFVVEDDNEIRRYLETALCRHYKVYTYSNGRAALDSIFDKKPDLVITDVMMPEMDGITLTRKIKQNINLNHIPVVILTAKTQEKDNIEALDSGAVAYIPKPFSIDVVLKTVENAIQSNQRLKVTFSGKQSVDDKVEDIKVQSNDEKLMERVMREINKNLSNSDITVEMIANSIGISRVHLHRKLKELTNQSTRDFIRNIRLQAAAKLLREKKLSVAEVSDLVGFKQPNNFSTCFKEMFGMTPTAYSAKYHNEP